MIRCPHDTLVIRDRDHMISHYLRALKSLKCARRQQIHLSDGQHGQEQKREEPDHDGDRP